MREKQHAVSAWRTIGVFLRGRACSDTLLHVLSRHYGFELAEEERAAQLLAGGIMQHGFQCGMLWGASLAAGALAYRIHGPGARAEACAVRAAQALATAFGEQNGHSNCVDITGIDSSSTKTQMFTYFLLKGGTVSCFRMAGRFAPVALKAIEGALHIDPAGESLPPAASCSALLARRMGASPLRSVMAAGLAGGIGLSGGACGALGAAIWLAALRSAPDKGGGHTFHSPEGHAALKRFLNATDSEFECARIAGRKFADVGDHARHVSAGGCAMILDALCAA